MHERIVILDHFHECYIKSIEGVEANKKFFLVKNSVVRHTWRTGSSLFHQNYWPESPLKKNKKLIVDENGGYEEGMTITD